MNRKSKPKTDEALPQEDRFMPTVTERSSNSQRFSLLPHRSLGSKTKGVPISIPSTPLDLPSPSYNNKGAPRKRAAISITDVDNALVYHTTSTDTAPKRINKLKTLDESKRKSEQTPRPQDTTGRHTSKPFYIRSPSPPFESRSIPSVSRQINNDYRSSSSSAIGSLKPALLRHSPKQSSTDPSPTTTHTPSLYRPIRLAHKTTTDTSTSTRLRSKDWDAKQNISDSNDSDKDECYYPARSSFDTPMEEAVSSPSTSTIPRLLLPPRPKRSRRLLAKSTPITIPTLSSSDDNDDNDLELPIKRKKPRRLDSTTVSAPVELSDEEMDDASDSILFTYPVNRSKGSITISKQDRRRLRPEEFLNDSVIDFYLKWLMDAYSGINGYRRHNERTKQDTKNTHIFSSFFYNRLTQGMASGGQVQYENVRKWTTDIDLFSKKYAIFPINEKWHWYLVLVCNIDKCVPSESRDADPLDTRDRPIMFVLDSLGGTSKTTMNHLTKYLIKEATNRRKVDPVDFVRPTLYTTNVPKQDNSCDCGVFLLHFVDQFLNSPRQFVDILLARDSRHVKWKEHEIKEKRRELLGLFAKVHRIYKAEHDSYGAITC